MKYKISTIIPNISLDECDSCIEVIKKNNPNCQYFEYNYDKEKKELYFYTDCEISTDMWFNHNYGTLISSINLIVSKINNKSNDLKNEKSVSLNEVINTYTSMKQSTKKYIIKDDTISLINNLHNQNFSLNYETNELTFSSIHNNIKIVFYYDHNILNIKEVIPSNDKNISIAGNYIFNNYDKLINIYNILKEKMEYAKCSFELKPKNSDFTYSFTNNKMEIKLPNGRIIYTLIYNDNNYLLIDSFDKYLDSDKFSLFDKVFIQIDDCPKCMRKNLENLKEESKVMTKKKPNL